MPPRDIIRFTTKPAQQQLKSHRDFIQASRPNRLNNFGLFVICDWLFVIFLDQINETGIQDSFGVRHLDVACAGHA